MVVNHFSSLSAGTKFTCLVLAKFMTRSFTHPSIWAKTMGLECSNEMLHEIQEEGASTKEQSI